MNETCQLHEGIEEKLELHDHRLNDHSNRIRNLELSQAKTEVQLTNIEKNQIELKAMMLENNKDNAKQLEGFMSGFMDKMSNILEAKINNDNKLKLAEVESRSTIKLTDRKELWGVIALVIGGLVSYLLK